MRSRERKCDSPKPKYGGAPCNEMEKTEREECRAEKCQGLQRDKVVSVGSYQDLSLLLEVIRSFDSYGRYC